MQPLHTNKMRSDILIALFLTAVIVPLCTSQSGERPTPVRKSACPSFICGSLGCFVFWYDVLFSKFAHISGFDIVCVLDVAGVCYQYFCAKLQVPKI